MNLGLCVPWVQHSLGGGPRGVAECRFPSKKKLPKSPRWLLRAVFPPPAAADGSLCVLSGRADVCAWFRFVGSLAGWASSLGKSSVSSASVLVESCVSLSRLRILCGANVSFLSDTDLQMFFSHSKAYTFLLLHDFSQSKSSMFRCNLFYLFLIDGAFGIISQLLAQPKVTEVSWVFCWKSHGSALHVWSTVPSE